VDTHICDVKRDGIHRKLFQTWQDHSVAAMEKETTLSKKSAALRCAFFAGEV
jgi:hypothetical protein